MRESSETTQWWWLYNSVLLLGALRPCSSLSLQEQFQGLPSVKSSNAIPLSYIPSAELSLPSETLLQSWKQTQAMESIFMHLAPPFQELWTMTPDPQCPLSDPPSPLMETADHIHKPLVAQEPMARPLGSLNRRLNLWWPHPAHPALLPDTSAGAGCLALSFPQHFTPFGDIYLASSPAPVTPGYEGLMEHSLDSLTCSW